LVSTGFDSIFAGAVGLISTGLVCVFAGAVGFDSIFAEGLSLSLSPLLL